MSDFRQNAEGIKSIANGDVFKSGDLGPANIQEHEYLKTYGRHAAAGSLSKPVSKSWLFEIVEEGRIVESFTLILPPQSYSIKEPQRVSITKTFGNAFVDDYGADNIQITLKGISGTAHVFPTFITQGAAKEFTDVALAANQAAQTRSTSGYTGRDAFYLFRNKIMRYKDYDGWDKKELRVYDLADEQSYKCVLLDFTLERNSDNPLRYPFVISLFVYERLDKTKTKAKSINISENPITALNDVDSLLDSLDNAYQGIQRIINGVSMVKARALELRTRWNIALGQVTGVLTSPLDITKNFIDSGFALLGIAYDTYKAGQYTFERYMGASEMIRQTLNKGLKVYGYQISEGWQRVRKLTVDGDSGVEAVEGASTTDPITSHQRISNPVSYTYSGLISYTVQGSDTLQQIAKTQLGDETLWPYIASVNNNISSNSDLVAGEYIFIPVQVNVDEGTRKEQFIFTEDTARDPYGCDLALDSDGNLIIRENNDFALVCGIENIKQAIDLRLNTEIGSLIKQSAYGISAQAGFAGSDMAVRYLKMAIRNTLIQDPRIDSVDNVIVALDADALRISMSVSVVGYEKSLPVPLEL